MSAAKRRDPLVSFDAVLPLLPKRQTRLDDVVAHVHRTLIAKMPKLTKAAVKDTISALVQAGQAHAGEGRKGSRTVGLSQPDPVVTAAQRAAAYWAEHPEATVREVAEAVGCSKTEAGRSRPKLSQAVSQTPDSEQRDNGTKDRDNAA